MDPSQVAARTNFRPVPKPLGVPIAMNEDESTHSDLTPSNHNSQTNSNYFAGNS